MSFIAHRTSGSLAYIWDVCPDNCLFGIFVAVEAVCLQIAESQKCKHKSWNCKRNSLIVSENSPRFVVSHRNQRGKQVHSDLEDVVNTSRPQVQASIFLPCQGTMICVQKSERFLRSPTSQVWHRFVPCRKSPLQAIKLIVQNNGM